MIMKTQKKLLLLILTACGLGFISCSDDEDNLKSFKNCRIESVKHTGADTNEYIYYFINFYQDNDRHCADYYFVKRNTNTENLLPKNINDSLGIGGYEVDVSFSGCMKEIADQTNAFHDSFHKYRFYSISGIEGFKINSITKNERTIK